MGKKLPNMTASKRAQLEVRGEQKAPENPKGPKIEKIQDRPPGLKFSIEIEDFNLDPQQTPIICGEF